MDEAAYEKLATRIREILREHPGQKPPEVATKVLAEIAVEMEVPERLHRAFVELLHPVMGPIVASVRSRLIRDLEEVAARPYLARAVNPGVVSQPDSKPVAISLTTPALTAPESDGDQRHPESHHQSVPLAPEREESDHGVFEIPSELVASPAPQDDDGLNALESRVDLAVPAERGDESGQQSIENHLALAAPVTPLSLRVEVLDGWRALKDELLYVPEFEDITYGAANATQRQRAMTYYHSVAGGWLDKARRMRALDQFIRSQGAECLDEVLGSAPALARRQP